MVVVRVELTIQIIALARPIWIIVSPYNNVCIPHPRPIITEEIQMVIAIPSLTIISNEVKMSITTFSISKEGDFPCEHPLSVSKGHVVAFCYSRHCGVCLVFSFGVRSEYWPNRGG